MRRAKLTPEYLESLGFNPLSKEHSDYFTNKVNHIGITVIFNRTYVAVHTYSALPVNIRPDKFRSFSKIKYVDEFTHIWEKIQNNKAVVLLEEEDFL